jgi:hypothetical protein
LPSSPVRTMPGLLWTLAGSIMGQEHARQWDRRGIWLVIGALRPCGCLGSIVQVPLQAALRADAAHDR